MGNKCLVLFNYSWSYHMDVNAIGQATHTWFMRHSNCIAVLAIMWYGLLCLLVHWNIFTVGGKFTHSSLVTPCGDIDLDQHWLMACCLTAPSHYLNKYWRIFNGVQWHSFYIDFRPITYDINLKNGYDKILPHLTICVKMRRIVVLYSPNK